MTDHSPTFLAQAMHAYMRSFQLLQEDFSDYDDDTGERIGSFRGIHVFIGSEVPSLAGFAVKMGVPVKRLKTLYNDRASAPEGCPFVDAIDLFKDFTESTIASAAAFELINPSFAKEMMRQWVGWKTDSADIEDAPPKSLQPTEAAARLQAVFTRIGKTHPDLLAIESTAEVVPRETDKTPDKQTIAQEIVKKRRARRLREEQPAND